MAKLALILDNIRSTHNVGSILRSADGFGVRHIFYSGYTPYPAMDTDTRLPHERNKISRAIHKTALGAELNIPFSTHSTVSEAIKAAKDQGFTVAALEQAPESVSLKGYAPPTKLAIILGNEVSGIASDTLAQSDVILEVPMFGKKESFNVSVATAICLYELTREYTDAA